MSIEGQVLSSTTVGTDIIWALVRGGIILLGMLYFVFSLIIVRQIHLMTETLITETAPVLRGLSIIHAGFALGLILLFIGFLFG